MTSNWRGALPVGPHSRDRLIDNPSLRFFLYTVDVDGLDKQSLLPPDFSLAQGGGYRRRGTARVQQGSIYVPNRRCKVRFHGASHLQVPIQLFEADVTPPTINAAGVVSNLGAGLDFKPGDAFTKFLEEQWLSLDQPWLVRLKTITDRTDVTAVEAAPTTGDTSGIDVFAADEITIALGAQTLNNVLNYSVEIYVQMSAAWSKIFETTLTTSFSQTIKLSRHMTRLYVRVVGITPATAGTATVSKTYSSDGISDGTIGPRTATLFMSAWYEAEPNGDR